MLESTFMATHSSFFAMVGVIDQFGHLRNALGSVLGLFGLLRWMREMITGRQTMGGEFREFVSGRPVSALPPTGAPGAPPPAKPSKKPLIIFLLAIFGIPYAMSKLVRLLQARAAEQAAANGGLLLPNGMPLPPLDPSSLTFARALYPFTPSNATELALKENEIVAITAKLDPRTGAEVDPRIELGEAVGGGAHGGVGGDAEWWKGRTRDGREGWFPKKWVEVLQRKNASGKVDEVKKVEA